MECVFSAWYNRMPGAQDPNLHVEGTCEVSSSSTELRLERGNEGIVDEPDLIVLRLIADEADVGDTQVVTKHVSWEADVGDDIQRVRIQGATDASISATVAV